MYIRSDFFSTWEWNIVEQSKKAGGGTGDAYIPSWKFYKDLLFLISSLVVYEDIDTMSQSMESRGLFTTYARPKFLLYFQSPYSRTCLQVR